MMNTVLRYSLYGAALLLPLGGCGGVTAFQGASAHSIIGTLPTAPPPPPKKAEAPPPRVEVRDNKIAISEKIQFDDNKATIKSESNSLLDEIVAVIKKNAHIKKIAIDGHASSEGNAARNKKLSDERAKSVMAYLVSHGIEQERLSAKGYGSEKPIAENTTEEGREKNRRVEFIIVEQDVTKRKVEIDPATGKEKKVLESSTQDVKTDEPADPDTSTATPKQKSSKHGKGSKKGDSK
jgi:OOP family OmpA-OmpF porin